MPTRTKFASKWLRELGKDEVKLLVDYGKKEVDADFSGIGGFMKLMEMMMGMEPAEDEGKNPKIAIIYAVGRDHRRRKRRRHVRRARPSARDTIVKALRDAADNDEGQRRSCCGSTALADRPWPAT